MSTGSELNLQLVTGVPEQVIYQTVTVYNKDLSSQCNLPAQIEPMQAG